MKYFDIAACAVGWFFGIVVSFYMMQSTIEHKYGYSLEELHSLKEQCESSLPRNKECKINPEFIIVDKE